MPDRRQFLQGSAAAMTALSLSARSMAAEPRVLVRPIPGTNEFLPVVGLGNSQAFRDGDTATSRRLLEIFLEYGGGYVDLAGPSRYRVIDLAERLDAGQRLFFGTYSEETSDAAMRRDLTAVREARGSWPLDLVLTRFVEDYAGRPDDFRRLKDDGIARYVGVARSDQRFHEPIMRLIEAGVVDFVQVNYSLLEPEAEDRLLPLARDRGVAVLINRPFVNGAYFARVKGYDLPDWTADFDCSSWAQFSLKFILAHPAVNCVLTETANPQHAIDNLGAGFGRLPDGETRQRMRDAIDKLG